MLLAVLYGLYEFIGVFVAQTIVDFTEGTIFVETYEPFIKGLVVNFLAPSSLAGQLLIGEFGVLTRV